MRSPTSSTAFPLRVRDIQVRIDRPQFILNPTSCDPFAIDFGFLDAEGAQADASEPFQVSDCSRLPYDPKFAVKVFGGTKRADHPRRGSHCHDDAWRSEHRSRRSDPSELRVPQQRGNRNRLHPGEFALGSTPGEKCPAGSVYGHAKVETPLLPEPLEGTLYLRSSEHTLPDIVVAFHNAEIDIVLHGRVDSFQGRIRTIFEAIPDAPISRFTIALPAKKGVLVNSKDLCTATNRLIFKLTGQNGKVTRSTQPFRPPSCAKQGG